MGNQYEYTTEAQFLKFLIVPYYEDSIILSVYL